MPWRCSSRWWRTRASRRSISSFPTRGRRSVTTSAGWCSPRQPRSWHASWRRAACCMRRPTGPTTRSRCRPCWARSRCSSPPSAALPRGRSRNSLRGERDSDTRSAIFTFGADKKLQQLVEEEASALRRANAAPVALDEPAPLRLLELRQHPRERQAGALLEECDRKPVHQAQRVQHELEGQLGRRYGRFARERGGRSEVVARLLDALVARDAIGKADLAVRASDGTARLVRAMDAPERREHGIVEALHAERDAVHARVAKAAEARRLYGAGIRLERDLGARLEDDARAHARQELVDRLRREK